MIYAILNINLLKTRLLGSTAFCIDESDISLPFDDFLRHDTEVSVTNVLKDTASFALRDRKLSIEFKFAEMCLGIC